MLKTNKMIKKFRYVSSRESHSQIRVCYSHKKAKDIKKEYFKGYIEQESLQLLQDIVALSSQINIIEGKNNDLETSLETLEFSLPISLLNPTSTDEAYRKLYKELNKIEPDTIDCIIVGDELEKYFRLYDKNYSGRATISRFNWRILTYESGTLSYRDRDIKVFCGNQSDNRFLIMTLKEENY